ncbi:hypothetical protein NE865_01386 [Phthorimaea operculella]|nr:hypothetical protein NE865_01386 [Phthorimaea operculella]
MLKACWDCISSATANREQPDGEQYGIHLNGDTQRAPPPPWPTPRNQNEKMFILPRILQFGDRINIRGQTTSNRRNLIISLLTESYDRSPDYRNAACQVEVNFSEDKIFLRNIVDGTEELFVDDIRASEIFSDPSSFYFSFAVVYLGDRGAIQVDVEGSSLGNDVALKHKVDNIRFLTVHGDVDKIDKLEFEFA